MQQDDVEQKADATTRASRSHDKPMNGDKRDNAKRMADELVAEEARRNPRSAVNTYLTAAVIGILIWAAIYYLWLKV